MASRQFRDAKEFVERVLEPSSEVLLAARRKGYDLKSQFDDVTAMGMVATVKRGLTTYEQLADTGVDYLALPESGKRVVDIAKRLATDVQYRSKAEKDLTALMEG